MRRLCRHVWSRFVSEEDGQVLVLLVTGFLVVILGVGALVLDYGNAVTKQRKLQAAADAAALAGAQRLPDTALATATAQDYGSAGTKGNAVSGFVPGSQSESRTTACSDGGSDCFVQEAVVVGEQASVPTTFGKLVGVDSIPVQAKAAACGPCITKPLDIVIVLDRTRSMCMDTPTHTQYPTCPDLTNARNGIKTFLSYLDPTVDRVAFAVTPPPLDPTDPCATPDVDDWHLNELNHYEMGQYPLYVQYPHFVDSNYVIVPLTNDYKNADGSLKTTSPLVQKVNCVQAGGSTSYAQALEKAQAEFAAHPRTDGLNAKKIIVFMSDGGANSAQASVYPNPSNYTQNPPPGQSWSPYITQPCGKAISVAGGIKSAGTFIYTIGYGVAPSGSDPLIDADRQCYQAMHGSVTYIGSDPSNAQREASGLTARDALQQIASPPESAGSPSNYFEQPTTDDLRHLFTRLAIQISQAKLIPIPPGA